MIVRNEEATLQRCLESAQDIVDTGSTDKTKEIARSFGAKIYDFKWNNDFSEARNFALAKATKDWCLILDADEYIIKGNQEDISYIKTYVSRIIYKGTQYIGRIHE